VEIDPAILWRIGGSLSAIAPKSQANFSVHWASRGRPSQVETVSRKTFTKPKRERMTLTFLNFTAERLKRSSAASAERRLKHPTLGAPLQLCRTRKDSSASLQLRWASFFWSMMKPRRNSSPVDGKRLSRARNKKGYAERKTIGAVSAPPSTQEITLFFRTFRPSSADLLHGRTACGRTLFVFRLLLSQIFKLVFGFFGQRLGLATTKP
jgi:hypothetical protein